MIDTLPINAVLPSATPSEAETAAWKELPRDEQAWRLRQMLTAPEASTPGLTTMGARADDEALPLALPAVPWNAVYR